MEGDSDLGDMVSQNREEYTIATCDFTSNGEKPWEVSVRKGTSVKVLEFKTQWWKVKVNDKIGYVPANCLKPLIPQVPSMPNEEQFSYMETDKVEIGCWSKEHDSAGILEGRSLETVERRRSSRLAENPALVPAKKSKVDLTWAAAVEQYQKQKKTPLEMFKTVSKAGPRDIVKAPGLNKISVFPDIDVKIEKLEPPDNESDDSTNSSVISEASSDTIATPLPTQTNNYDLSVGNSSSNPVVQCSVQCSSNPKLTHSIDNSSNPCCVLFAKVWEVLGVLYDPVPKRVCENCDVIKTSNVVLSMRLVCRDWRKGIDTFYNNISDAVYDEIFQSNVRNRQPIPRNLKPRETPIFFPSTWYVYNFKSSYKIQKFLDHFKGTHSVPRSDSEQGTNICNNPFFGRFVCFRRTCISEYGMHEYKSWAAKLLKKYGSHIWYCSIQIDDDIPDINSHLTSLLELLRLMPNLRCFHWRNEYLEMNNWLPEDESNAYKYFVLILRRAFAGQVQPILAELKHLQQVNFSTLPLRVLFQFLLGDSDSDNLPNPSGGLDIKPLEHLKDLRLSIYSEDEFKHLEVVKQNWSLQRLAITVYIDLTNITFRRTIKIAERWKNTLTHVSIKYPFWESDNNLPWRLDLPCVKYLKLHFMSGSLSYESTTLDFLFSTRASLEYLHLIHSSLGLGIVAFDDMESIRENPLHVPVKYPGEGVLLSNKQIPLINNDYNSNIWNVFLKLKTIHEERYHLLDKEANFTYTREGWLNYRHTNQAIRPVILFQMGVTSDCHSTECEKNPRKTLSEYNEARVKTSLDSEYEKAAWDLLCAWQSLNNIDLDKNPAVEMKLMAKFLQSVRQDAKKKIYPSLEAYYYSNYRKNCYRNINSCGLCPSKPIFEGEESMDEHFRVSHFLYGGFYKCDYIGCDEMYPSKYDVVQHRVVHGRKHIKKYYELEAEPLQNLGSMELKLFFNWIHVNPPHRFAGRREWKDFRKSLRPVDV